VIVIVPSAFSFLVIVYNIVKDRKKKRDQQRDNYAFCYCDTFVKNHKDVTDPDFWYNAASRIAATYKVPERTVKYYLSIHCCHYCAQLPSHFM
jgi:hypothetical protein